MYYYYRDKEDTTGSANTEPVVSLYIISLGVGDRVARIKKPYKLHLLKQQQIAAEKQFKEDERRRSVLEHSLLQRCLTSGKVLLQTNPIRLSEQR